MLHALSGQRVFITGASGFIGGRLVERLAADQQISIRALVRDFCHAGRLARFPVEIVRGDVTDGAAVERAVEGADIIFHCAYGNSGDDAARRSVNVGGTRNILQAARTHKVRRIVHLSTILVYGRTPDGPIDESAPRRTSDSVYADSKLEAEKLVFEFGSCHELPVTVLQPAEVYGPYATAWTQNVLRTLKESRQILVDGGGGFANPVYIDDLIDAMLLAAVKPEAVGEAFIIGAAAPVTWKEFYGAFERMLGTEATVCLSCAEARALYRSTQRCSRSFWHEAGSILFTEPAARSRVLKSREARFARRTAALLPANVRGAVKHWLRRWEHGAAVPSRGIKPVRVLDPLLLHLAARKTVFGIAKARRLLGYEPRFSFAEGMRRTEQWARWANLI